MEIIYTFNNATNVSLFTNNLYSIKVRLEKQAIDAYGQAQSLKPGMTLGADILQDRRRIWEWIIEPVLALSQDF